MKPNSCFHTEELLSGENEKTLTNSDDYMVTAAYLEKCYLFYLQYIVNYSINFYCVWQIS